VIWGKTTQNRKSVIKKSLKVLLMRGMSETLVFY
jgi:hypothetical protein